MPRRIDLGPHLQHPPALNQDIYFFSVFSRDNSAILNQSSHLCSRLFQRDSSQKKVFALIGRSASRIGAHHFASAQWDQALCDAFLPAFSRDTFVDALHRNAVLDRTNKRTKIAAHTVMLVYARNPFKRS